MIAHRLTVLLVPCLLGSSTWGQEPSYVRQVRPFLAKYCVECHPAENADGGLSVDSFKGLMAGGDHGAVLVPGKPEQSRIVRMVEGKTGPRMPPRKSKQPLNDEIPLLRAWIGAGAKDDSATAHALLPAIPARHRMQPPIAALAYQPRGSLLAAGRYRDLVLIDTASGEIKQTHADLDGKVTALAFDSAGTRLAAALGEAGQSGKILLASCGKDSIAKQTILEGHWDVIFALAFSPDGKLLASCGYDRLIKLWDASTGKLVRDLKDHSDAVYGVGFSPDGKLLASGGADRAVKVWDVGSGTRLYTLGESTDWVYAVAWNPDGKHLAAAGVDKSIRVWEVNREGGNVVHSVFAHEGPVSALAYSADGKTLYSLGQDRRLKAWDSGRMVERQVFERASDTPLSLAIRPDGKQLAVGRFDGVLVLLDEKTGKVQAQPLPPAVKKTNHSPRTGEKVQLPVTINDGLDRAGEVDYFRFDAAAGQQIGVQLQVNGGTLEPVLVLVDPEGRELTESTSGVLGHTCAKAGTYALGVRDREYRGGSKYRLQIGDLPVVTAVFPLGVRRGSEAEVQVEGVHLGQVRSIRVKVPADAALGSRIPLTLTTPHGKPLGNPSIVIGEFPDVLAVSDKVVSLRVNSTANGRLAGPGATETWRFTAKKGERLLVDVEARRLGSPLDSTLEILDGQGKPLPRAVLRCVSRTYTTFRDHDSAGPGIRIETWNELAVNDYLHVGNELLRIRELPKNPDDDCQFFQLGGRRRGYLGTTPGQLSLGTPMYKVTIHPPGTTFPPSGLPNITLYWRNDDGDALWGKDSFLDFTAPADGDYLVRVGDARGQGSPQHAYRLTLHKPRPDFSVSYSPTSPTVWQGGAIPMTVTATRRDGFDGDIRIQLDELPPGFSAPVATIPAGENSTAFALFADASAKPSTKPLKLISRAMIDGKEVVREAVGGLAKTVPVGDIITTTEQSEVTVRPGGQVRLAVKIERKNFTSRVPLDVRGLPHGVRVLDIGLNGILINPGETMRTIVIQCDPWVQPTEHPFVVLARREGKNTEHAAKSVLLKVVRR
jgi:hypothetical protein